MTPSRDPRIPLPALLLLAACAAPGTNPMPSRAEAAAMNLAPADSALVAELDAFTRERIARDSLSGVVLFARGDAPIYIRTTGLANRATDTPNRLDTRFNLASVDKFFTRIAIRQLQQQDRLRMTDLVGAHLPEYPNARVRDEVTIKHLYDMRAGMGDFDSDNYRSYLAAAPNLRTLDDYIALFAKDTLSFAPGTATSYSNAGYVVLGKVIERVSGLSYYEYVQRHIFDPAGMRNSGWFPPPDDRVTNTAVGYTTAPKAAGDFRDDAPKLSERRPNTSLLAFRGSSAGGGYSTAEDLMALSRALRGHRLLSAALTDSLYMQGDDFRFTGWAGGGEGVNVEFYLHSTGHTLIVMSNYDPPSATVFRRKLWGEWLPAWLNAEARGSGSTRPW